MINITNTIAKYHHEIVKHPVTVTIIIINTAIMLDVLDKPSPPTKTAISIFPTKKFK